MLQPQCLSLVSLSILVLVFSFTIKVVNLSKISTPHSRNVLRRPNRDRVSVALCFSRLLQLGSRIYCCLLMEERRVFRICPNLKQNGHKTKQPATSGEIEEATFYKRKVSQCFNDISKCSSWGRNVWNIKLHQSEMNAKIHQIMTKSF